MFGFLTSPRKRARQQADRWLELGATVWHFRRDLLAPAEAEAFCRCQSEVKRLLADRADAPQLERATAALEAAIRRIGGAHYPRSALAENVEFFLVAAIVILGIRAYFLQQMVIPTNSMWPSYNGMTAENFPPASPAPGPALRLLRLAAFQAVRHEMDAPASGEVSAPVVVDADGQPHLVSGAVMGRSWLLLPEKRIEYTLFVGDAPVRIQLPADFDAFEQVFRDTYFRDAAAWADQFKRAQAAGRVRELSIAAANGVRYPAYLMPVGATARAGDPIIRFDLLGGDRLFVDRLSYHFIRPKVGSGFVFETGKIPDLVQMGVPDEYFVKRLAGVPGDTLEIKEPVLYRNGQPITGAAAFDRNARREGQYRGYFNLPAGVGRYLLRGQTLAVPPGFFLGLGDNSLISEDGRYWGFVPAKEVMGRPIFVWYPLSRHWGWAN